MIDNAISPATAELLRGQGYDVVHVRELGLASASDREVLQRARDESRIVVSRDGDFSALLAHSGADGPSFLHLRTPGVNRPNEQAELILRAMKSAASELASGAIVAVRGARIRVRRLPV